MLILSMLSLLASAKLTIYFNGQMTNLNYSMGNFGHVPYGRTMSGMLIKPEELSDQQTFDLCNTTITGQTNMTNYWAIVKKGNCSETTKAIAAQKLGAKLLIIVSDYDNLTSKVQMVNDGMGFKVHIPAVLIGRLDGDKIFKEFETLGDARPYGVISFNDSKRVQNPPVILFLTLYDVEGFKFVREFKKYYQSMQSNVSFGITYNVIVSKYDQKNNFSKENPDCLGGGRYCYDTWTIPGNGRQVIEEQLRQQCIWQSNTSQWFDYMEYFNKNCFNIEQFEQCYKDNKIVDQENVKQCVSKSFIQENEKTRELWQNILMDQWVSNKSSSGMMYYPGVLVNNVPYKGNLEAYGVFEDICSNMINQTICDTIKLKSSEKPESSSSIDWAMISFAVVTCIIFGIFLFICYRRRLKKQMQQELGQQVNEMVSQYIKFYETKNEA